MKRITGLLAVAVVALSMSAFASTPDLSTCDVYILACHYTNSSRETSYNINRVVIHKTEGATASGAANWFANCASGGSAHFTFDKANGYCYQSVLEEDIAWQAGYSSTNSCSVGIEHSGWVSSNDTSTACYNESAIETKSCVTYYAVPCNRTYIIGHNQVPGCANPGGGGTSCHTDPGAYWNWNYYMSKCNPVTNVDRVCDNSSGSFTASLTSSQAFLAPGTEPFTKIRPRSASVRTTSRFCWVRWRSPMWPAIFLFLNTRPGSWRLPVEP